MLEKFKNISLVSKILYLLALVLLLVWVIPTMLNYYSTLNTYETSREEIQQTAAKYSISKDAENFSVDAFKKETESLFSKVTVTPLEMDKYSVNIQMKREDIEKFHTFLDTVALKFLVQIETPLKFESKDNNIKVKMILVQL